MITENDSLGVRQATASAINGSRRSAEVRKATSRTPHIATAEHEYTGREMEFLRAIESYKGRTGRKYPSWTEVLSVVQELGYVKPM